MPVTGLFLKQKATARDTVFQGNREDPDRPVLVNQFVFSGVDSVEYDFE